MDRRVAIWGRVLHWGVLAMAVVLGACSSGTPVRRSAEAPVSPSLGESYTLAPFTWSIPKRYPPELSGDVEPKEYEVVLDLTEAETFGGVVTIAVEVHSPVHTVWLHAENLEISEASVRQGDSEQIAESRQTGEGSRLALALSKPLTKGAAKIRIAFRGALPGLGIRRAEEHGLYTLFEPNLARTAFPCFDHPRFKTPWTLELRIPKEHEALGNAPIARSSEDAGARVVRFEPTAKLPSYLVAFATGRFRFEEVEGAPMRVAAFEAFEEVDIAKSANLASLVWSEVGGVLRCAASLPQARPTLRAGAPCWRHGDSWAHSADGFAVRTPFEACSRT